MTLTNRAVMELVGAFKTMSAKAPNLPWRAKYAVARWLVVLVPAVRAIEIARQKILEDCVARTPVAAGDEPDAERRVLFSDAGHPVVALPGKYRRDIGELEHGDSGVASAELPRFRLADLEKAGAELRSAELAVLMMHDLVDDSVPAAK